MCHDVRFVRTCQLSFPSGHISTLFFFYEGYKIEKVSYLGRYMSRDSTSNTSTFHDPVLTLDSPHDKLIIPSSMLVQLCFLFLV